VVQDGAALTALKWRDYLNRTSVAVVVVVVVISLNFTNASLA